MDLIFPALSALLITSASIYPVMKLAEKLKLIDNPKIRPHPAHTQKRIVPRAGGLAIFLGIALSLLLFTPLTKTSIGILISISLLLFIGLLDDRIRNLSPYTRLGVQFLAAGVSVASGIGIKFITNPFGGILNFDTSAMTLFAAFLAIFWIVWVMNMINWSKGVDGQMPGIIAVAAIILGILSFKLSLTDPGQLHLSKLSFITAGSALGFLVFNWHPAKIFPGFSGSTILGFMVAVLSILSGAKLATAGLVLLIPATDFAYTFLRRIASGKSPVWADKKHLHHKFLELGLTHAQISLFYILGSAILGAAALTLTSSGKLFALILVGTVLLGGIIWLNFFGALSKRHDPDNG